MYYGVSSIVSCDLYWLHHCCLDGLYVNLYLVALYGRSEVVNPGNTLYVTGLSTRVTERELEEHFSKEGKVSPFYCT